MNAVATLAPAGAQPLAMEIDADRAEILAAIDTAWAIASARFDALYAEAEQFLANRSAVDARAVVL